jgi:N-acetylglucosaminyl-diphospho-decaprenol L-rhamnosyltransferase
LCGWRFSGRLATVCADRPKTVAVVVAYASRQFIGAALSQLAENLGEESLIVVDNASLMDDADYVEALFPKATVIRSRRNLGFPGGANIGVRHALSVGADRIVLANPDSVPEPGALDTLARCLDENPRVGVAAPRLRNPGGTFQPTVRHFPTHLSILFARRSPLWRWHVSKRYHYSYILPEPESACDVDLAAFTFVVVRREVFDDVGLFDERFTLFAEDIDFCYRMAQSGKFKVRYLPEAVVYHEWGASTKTVKWRTTVWHHRGTFRFFTKHYPRARFRNAGIGLLLFASLGARFARRLWSGR